MIVELSSNFYLLFSVFLFREYRLGLVRARKLTETFQINSYWIVLFSEAKVYGRFLRYQILLVTRVVPFVCPIFSNTSFISYSWILLLF
jgi:hypothetical protein